MAARTLPRHQDPYRDEEYPLRSSAGGGFHHKPSSWHIHWRNCLDLCFGRQAHSTDTSVAAHAPPYGLFSRDRTTIAALNSPELKSTLHRSLGFPGKSGLFAILVACFAAWCYYRMTSKLAVQFWLATSGANWFFHHVNAAETTHELINYIRSTLPSIVSLRARTLGGKWKEGNRAYAIGLAFETLFLLIPVLAKIVYSFSASIGASMVYIQALMGNEDESAPNMAQTTAGIGMMLISAYVNMGPVSSVVDKFFNFLRDYLAVPLIEIAPRLAGRVNFLQEARTRSEYLRRLFIVLDALSYLADKHQEPLAALNQAKHDEAVQYLTALFPEGEASSTLTDASGLNIFLPRLIINSKAQISQIMQGSRALTLEAFLAVIATLHLPEPSLKEKILDFFKSLIKPGTLSNIAGAAMAYVFITGTLNATLVALGYTVQKIMQEPLPFISDLLKDYSKLGTLPQAITTLALVFPLFTLLQKVFKESFSLLGTQIKETIRYLLNCFLSTCYLGDQQAPPSFLRRLGYFFQALFFPALAAAAFFSCGASARGAQGSINLALMGNSSILANDILTTMTTYSSSHSSFLTTPIEDMGLKGLQDFFVHDGSIKFSLLAVIVGVLGAWSNLATIIKTIHNAVKARATGVRFCPESCLGDDSTLGIRSNGEQSHNLYLAARHTADAIRQVISILESDLCPIHPYLMSTGTVAKATVRAGYHPLSSSAEDINRIGAGKYLALKAPIVDEFFLGKMAFKSHRTSALAFSASKERQDGDQYDHDDNDDMGTGLFDA